MANIKSQIKRNLQNERRRERNKDAARSELRISRQDGPDRPSKALDDGATVQGARPLRAASTRRQRAGVIHPNQAARRKSRTHASRQQGQRRQVAAPNSGAVAVGDGGATAPAQRIFGSSEWNHFALGIRSRVLLGNGSFGVVAERDHRNAFVESMLRSDDRTSTDGECLFLRTGIDVGHHFEAVEQR